jgi:hypothetical protein
MYTMPSQFVAMLTKQDIELRLPMMPNRPWTVSLLFPGRHIVVLSVKQPWGKRKDALGESSTTCCACNLCHELSVALAVLFYTTLRSDRCKKFNLHKVSGCHPC